MVAKKTLHESISVGRIFLQQDNPRHVPLPDEASTIAALCSREDVVPIARDISKLGLNPLENFAVVPTTKTRSSAAQTYIVAEGNRRLCALKLLNDPDLAPSRLRKIFNQLSDQWTPIKSVSAIVFKNNEEVRVWLERTHNGANGGIGRKQWNAEQKTRFDGDNKNTVAQSLLDYAEKRGMLSNQQRERKLTTVQRFISNPIFREMLGLDLSDEAEIKRTRTTKSFDGIAGQFIADLLAGVNVNSRMNKEKIEKYARALGGLPDASESRIQAEPLLAETSGKTTKAKKTKPKQAERARVISHEASIRDALTDLKNDKLTRLYYSVCTVELERHTPLVAIGVWAFFETLTACAGRDAQHSFDSFFNKLRLQGYGLGAYTPALREAVARIAAYGNTTKHHPIAVTVDGDQLNNDVVTLKDVILKCIAEAKGKQP